MTELKDEGRLTLPSRRAQRVVESSISARSLKAQRAASKSWRTGVRGLAVTALALTTVAVPVSGFLSPHNAQAADGWTRSSSLLEDLPTQVQAPEAQALRERPAAVTRAAIRQQIKTDDACLKFTASANGVRTALTSPEEFEKSDKTLLWPLDKGQYTLASKFGMRVNPVLGIYMLHAGVDMSGASGTPIHSAAAGEVLRVGWDSGLGYSVEIYHENLNATTVYGHMISGSSPLRAGDKVNAGQMIGRLGSTGNSTGPHLHFEVHPGGRDSNPTSAVEPLNWMRSKGAQYIADYNSAHGCS
ncbi:M23 family metallopeptidase [Actinomycetaceae bacterium TAE3-ERU4]|nr:M23 family metallopeptidase [Actinomycetaceae bacterium TAE3-ERU4]